MRGRFHLERLLPGVGLDLIIDFEDIWWDVTVALRVIDYMTLISTT